QTLLHIHLLGRREGKEIDHRNGNGLDCRRRNLRFLSHLANVLNRKSRVAKSGRVGVIWRSSRSCWVASILHKGIRHVKHCPTFEAACQERERMEREYFGVSASDLIRHDKIAKEQK